MFRFSLEPLLKHRVHQEEKRQKELAEARQRLEREEMRKTAIEDAIATTGKDFARKIKAGILLAERIVYSQYLEQQRRELIKVEQRRILFGQHVVLARKNLVEARKKRRMLENLKEKRRSDYQHQMQKKEQDFINEMATQRYIRSHPV